MGLDSGGKRQLSDILKATAAIVGAPLALFAVINNIVAQPIAALIVALIMAALASVWVFRSGRTGVTELLVAWLALVVVVLAGFVIWPRTMVVEGVIVDTAGNPVRSEAVVLVDVDGVVRQAETDAVGYYQFRNVPTGLYKIRVRGFEGGGGAGGFFVRRATTNLTVPEIVAVLSPTPADTPLPSPTQPPLPTDTPTLTPTATPSSLPTETPTSPPTSTPTPEATDTPAPPPTNTPTPAPLVHIFNAENGDTVAQTLSLVGEYAPEVTGDIWIFTGPLGGARWPQSSNACAGEGTLKLDGRWEVPIGLGGPDNVGERFEIIVTTADAEASQFLAQTLQTWCENNYFPGLSRDELPAGLTEHEHIVVTRGPDLRAPRLDISTAELPGQVMQEGINDGDALPQTVTVGGTYTNDVTGHIWVLVYSPDGRFYPQSMNACEGISTVQLNGFWETRINLGGEGDAGKPFDIVVVLVNEEVHAIFEARQGEGCRTGSFAGYLSIELPQGIEEKDSVSVVRQ